MPGAQLVNSANTMLSAASAPRLVKEFPEQVAALAKPGSLVSVAAKVLKLSKSDREYIKAIPTAIQEAIRAAIFDAMGKQKSVQLHYTPGYDYGLSISDYGEAVGIHLTGPYTPGRPKDYAAGVRSARASETTIRTAAKKTTRRTTAKKPTRRSRSR